MRAGLARAGRALLVGVLENVNGLACLGGACWLYVGIAEISRSVANIVAGLLVMAIGVFPYLQRKRKP